MNNKLILVIVAAGIVAFSMAFFRTGKPEISGLDRPEIKLGSFKAGMVDTGKSPSAPVKSRFSKGESKSKPATTKRKPAARRKAKSSGSKAAHNRASGVRTRNASTKKATGLKSRGRNWKDRKGRNERMEEHKRRMSEARKQKDLDRLSGYNEDIGYGAEMDGVAPGMMEEEMIEEHELGIASPHDLSIEAGIQ